MKIVIDARSVDIRQSGVGNHVTQLIRGLKTIDGRNQYGLMVTRGQLKNAPTFFDQFEVYQAPFSNENHIFGDPWEFFLLPKELRKRGVNLFHGPAFMAPPFHKGFKSVSTIHDLVAFHHPHTIPTKYAYYMRFLIHLMIRRADAIITVSEFIRHEIIQQFKVDEGRIFAVPNSVSDHFRPVDDNERINALKLKYGIKKRYFLHVGNIEPRKNLVNLFRACDRIWDKLHNDFQLVVVGKRGWLYSEIFDTLKKAEFSSNVVFTGYVSDDDMPVLYSGADFFIFPSVYEGFGLPILEAMRCGVPVITSRVASLPEVAGEAALYVNPHNPDDIAEKMMTLAYDDTLKEALREKGFHQARNFSWEKTARKTLDVYEMVG